MQKNVAPFYVLTTGNDRLSISYIFGEKYSFEQVEGCHAVINQRSGQNH